MHLNWYRAIASTFRETWPLPPLAIWFFLFSIWKIHRRTFFSKQSLIIGLRRREKRMTSIIYNARRVNKRNRSLPRQTYVFTVSISPQNPNCIRGIKNCISRPSIFIRGWATSVTHAALFRNQQPRNALMLSLESLDLGDCRLKTPMKAAIFVNNALEHTTATSHPSQQESGCLDTINAFFQSNWDKKWIRKPLWCKSHFALNCDFRCDLVTSPVPYQIIYARNIKLVAVQIISIPLLLSVRLFFILPTGAFERDWREMHYRIQKQAQLPFITMRPVNTLTW